MALIPFLTARTVFLSLVLVLALSSVPSLAFFVAPPVHQHALVGVGRRNVVAPSASSSAMSSSLSFLTMRVGKRSKSKRGDGTLAVINAERLAAAGRRGTKKFIDPCKVFCGNLPYDADENDVRGFFKDNLGHDLNLKSVKVIRDWKTGQSKGYGFCIFSDPMFATAAMEFCKNRKLMGRTLILNQGKRKLDENELYVKKKKKKPVDDEEAAIAAGLEQAETEELDLSKAIELDGFNNEDDSVLFGENDNDDDFEFDGVFEEEYPEEFDPLADPTLNREQRRDAAKRRPRRKLPHKGFESQPQWEYDGDGEIKNEQPDWVEPE